MAFAADGSLYVAHFNGGCVEIFDPSGNHVGAVSIPGANVTNIAFAPDGETAVVTEVTTASVYRVRLGVAGLPLYDGRS
jgi:sugar lactone lactonase YvrE